MARSGPPGIGDVFGDFRITEVIGRGGMGIVYLAEDTTLKRMVALKVLPQELADDDDFRRRFIRESQMAASMEHPNIVPIYEARERAGTLYIAMRYIAGSDLKGIIRSEGVLDGERTLRLLDQVGAALDEAHEQGLVHRDVKPQNILVQPGTRHRLEHAYLTDFGLTKPRDSRTLTTAGTMVGTIDYMSPEQLLAGDVDARTDVYSFGCVLYECLTGSPPFVRESHAATIAAHLHEPPPRLSAGRPELPRAMDDVLASALAKDRDARFASCGEAIRRAREALAETPTVISPHPARALTPGDTVVPPRTRSQLGLASAPQQPSPATVRVDRAGPRANGGRRKWILLIAGTAVVLGGATFLSLRQEGDVGEAEPDPDVALSTPSLSPSPDFPARQDSRFGHDLRDFLDRRSFGDFTFQRLRDISTEGFVLARYSGPGGISELELDQFETNAAAVANMEEDIEAEKGFGFREIERGTVEIVDFGFSPVVVLRHDTEAAEAIYWMNGNVVLSIHGPTGDAVDFFRELSF